MTSSYSGGPGGYGGSLREQPRTDWSGGLQFLGGLVALMWVMEVIDTAIGNRLDFYGIEPREIDGIFGIFLAPVLHAGFGHLFANTVPLLMLGTAIALSGAARLVSVTAIVWLVSGVGVWLISPPSSLTIGASGLVFGYAAYLITRGVFSRRLIQLGVGVLVILVWGGALLGGLLPQDGISWQGHLFGGVGGVLAAWLLARRGRDTGARTRF